MEQLRQVQTPYGVLSYFLERKNIKNLNLRLSRGSQIFVSVPLRATPERADQLVREKAAWILQAQARARQERRELEPMPSREECQRRLAQALSRMYPRISPLGVGFPQLKIRKMKSQWGNCHWRQGYITLNAVLARCPEELRDYVALHELAHFLHHDHGPGFYALMTALMPDWQRRRQALKGCAWALEP